MRITATQIKQNSAILQEALKEDIVVTKREKPFVVIIDYEKYRKLEKMAKEYETTQKAKTMQNLWLKSAKESEKRLNRDDKELYDAINREAMSVMDRADD
jgi:prevent-host-death family protein